jgi:hypothetical protein
MYERSAAGTLLINDLGGGRRDSENSERIP